MDLPLLLELDLIGSIYDAVIEPARWAETLDRIRLFLRFQTAMLSVNALPSGEMIVHATSNISADLLALTPELGMHAVALWGGPAVVSRLPLEEPLVFSQYVEPESWVGNEYYERFAKPQRLVDQVILLLESNPVLVANVGFTRHETMPPISSEQIGLLRVLAPHFRRAAVLSGILDARAATARTFEAALATLKLPVFLVAGDLTVVHKNTGADKLIDAFPALLHLGDKLNFVGKMKSGQIEAAVRSAIADASVLANGNGIPIRVGVGRTLLVHVLPLRRTGTVESAAVAALFVVDPTSPIDYPLEAIRLIYRLRPAEVRVLELTLKGLTGPQIAKELSVAPSTIKTHMLALFDKFGVSTKVDLVSAVFAATPRVLP